MAPVLGVLFAVALAGAAGEGASRCARVGADLFRVLDQAQFEKEPEGSVRRVYDEATRAAALCPDDEGLAYLRLRSAELGRGALVGEVGPDTLAELRRLADEAAARFPRSARILTVDARVTRRADVARRACAADAAYVPARVALADVLVATGDWRGAERALGDKPMLASTSDGFVVLARIKLAKGDARGAIQAASEALHARAVDLIEPDARNPRPAVEAREIAARARELNHSAKRSRHQR